MKVMKVLENRKIHFGIVLLALLLSVVTLVITIRHRTSISNIEIEDNNNIPQESSLSFETVCFDCGKLIQNPYKTNSNHHLFEFLQVEIRDGHSVCCLNNTHQMELLVSAMLKDAPSELSPPKADKNNISEPVAAHKFLFGAKENDVRIEQHIYLLFHINNSVNEHVNGIAVLEHGLIIQYTGMYYVYSSIRLTSARNDSLNSTYTSNVEVISPHTRSTTILLKAQYSGSKVFQESTFTGGVFFLHAGDVVQVCVSDPGVVDSNESTYAGLIMLG